MLELEIKSVNMDSNKNEIILHEEDAMRAGVNVGDRVKLVYKKKTTVCLVNTTDTIVKKGKVGVFANVFERMKMKKGGKAHIHTTSKPESVDYIKKKMSGHDLTKDEIFAIIRDTVDRNLSDVELTAYMTSIAIRGLNIEETEHLTLAMVETGETIDLDTKPVFDFHSIGGVPGNKITLLIVPIVAATGLHIPKTCSRAISSACGTADIFETIAPVCLTLDQIKDIGESVGGTIAWGGAVNMAPADDIIIKVEYPLSLDPYSQVIASVLAKKKGVGADFLVLDIPQGKETKVKDMALARQYANDFIEIGRRIGINVDCAITYGGQPIGRNIGPKLEAKEALEALEWREVPTSLISKATAIAGKILEIGGEATPGTGKDMAHDLMKSGKALKKFKEIIKAQGGDPDISSKDLKPGKHKYEYKAPSNGYISSIHNKRIAEIARAAGSPHCKGAGIVLSKKRGTKVMKDETIFTVYADHKDKLENAVAVIRNNPPMTVEGMVLEYVPSYFGTSR